MMWLLLLDEPLPSVILSASRRSDRGFRNKCLVNQFAFKPVGGWMLIGQWSGNPLGMNYDYAYANHLGSITGWSDAAGVYLSNSIALHEPFGAYRFRPPASVNPGISDRGFTGHRKKSPIPLQFLPRSSRRRRAMTAAAKANRVATLSRGEATSTATSPKRMATA